MDTLIGYAAWLLAALAGLEILYVLLDSLMKFTKQSKHTHNLSRLPRLQQPLSLKMRQERRQQLLDALQQWKQSHSEQWIIFRGELELESALNDIDSSRLKEWLKERDYQDCFTMKETIQSCIKIGVSRQDWETLGELQYFAKSNVSLDAIHVLLEESRLSLDMNDPVRFSFPILPHLAPMLYLLCHENALDREKEVVFELLVSVLQSNSDEMQKWKESTANKVVVQAYANYGTRKLQELAKQVLAL